jgi:hypothetical protein
MFVKGVIYMVLITSDVSILSKRTHLFVGKNQNVTGDDNHISNFLKFETNFDVIFRP